MNEIESDTGYNAILIISDEITDRCLSIYLICGEMRIVPPHAHLIACGEIEKVYHTTITSLINVSLSKLWPNTDKFCVKFVSCISDVALYAVKAVTPILS